jgi:hypothetical protein
MTALHITHHAIQRYIARVDPSASPDTARAALDTPATRAAAQFGATFVRLATGHRIVVQDFTVVTVMPADNYRKQVCRHGLPRYNRQCRVPGGGHG